MYRIASHVRRAAYAGCVSTATFRSAAPGLGTHLDASKTGVRSSAYIAFMSSGVTPTFLSGRRGGV